MDEAVTIAWHVLVSKRRTLGAVVAFAEVAEQITGGDILGHVPTELFFEGAVMVAEPQISVSFGAILEVLEQPVMNKLAGGFEHRVIPISRRVNQTDAF